MGSQDFEDAFSRIRDAVKARTMTEVAGCLGIKASSISRAKARNVVPDSWLIILYRRFRVEPDWILTGHGPKSRCAEAAETRAPYPMPAPRIVVYSMLGVDAATGRWLPQPLETIPLPDALSTPAILAVRMHGKAMEPTIRQGAFVGIDTGGQAWPAAEAGTNEAGTRRRTSPMPSGEIYALDVLGEGLVIRRAYRQTDGKLLVLAGGDSAYPPLRLPLDGPEYAVVGRVAWTMQSV